jgi:outer membrane protein assembly factor BamB
MGGRVYVGSDQSGGRLFSVDASDGSEYHDDHFDGQVKDFVWPDWRNAGDLYFATDNFVWAFHDNGTTLANKFAGGISLGTAKPTSGVLLVPGTQLVYVGADDGRLYEIDASGAAPSLKWVQLGDGLAAVGAPSLDWPNNLIHVGTEAGVFYAVDIPLP